MQGRTVASCRRPSIAAALYSASDRLTSTANLHATMVAPFGAAAATIVPVATVIVMTAITPVIVTIAAVIVAAEIPAVAAMIVPAIMVTILLTVASIALRLGRSGNAKAERRESQSGSDQMRKLHETSSRTRQSGCTVDTAI